jgi:hypothetical protein
MEHDYDGHGGCVLDCRTCRAEAAEAARDAALTRVGKLEASLMRIEYWGRADVANAPTAVRHRMWNEARAALGLAPAGEQVDG